MTISTNVVEYMSYTLAKGLEVDKQYLQDSLTDQGFFEGKNVNCEELDIQYSRCSNNINHLEKIGAINIETDGEIIRGLQLSDYYLNALSILKPHYSYKNIERHMFSVSIARVSKVQEDLIVDLCTMIDKYLPTGFGMYHEREETSLYKTDFIIRSANGALSYYIEAYDTIHKVTLCLNRVFDCRIQLAIAQSLEYNTNKVPIHMAMLKFPNDKKVTKQVYTEQQRKDVLNRLEEELKHQFE